MDREAGKASSCEAGPAVWVPALVAGKARSHACHVAAQHVASQADNGTLTPQS